MKAVKPLLRGHFHQAMFFITLGACALLIAKSNSSIEYLSTIIYSLGALLLFGISSLYHRINWDTSRRAMMKKFDHAAIYIMIAGTFTPICLLSLSSDSGTTLLISIWSVTLVGVMQSIFFVNLPKYISAIIYMIAGYMILPYVGELLPKLGLVNVSLLVAGGIVYSLGAISYGLKRPIMNPKVFGYHELFHIMVCIGAILHFMVIYSTLS